MPRSPSERISATLPRNPLYTEPQFQPNVEDIIRAFAPQPTRTPGTAVEAGTGAELIPGLATQPGYGIVDPRAVPPEQRSPFDIPASPGRAFGMDALNLIASPFEQPLGREGHRVPEGVGTPPAEDEGSFNFSLGQSGGIPGGSGPALGSYRLGFDPDRMAITITPLGEQEEGETGPQKSPAGIPYGGIGGRGGGEIEAGTGRRARTGTGGGSLGLPSGSREREAFSYDIPLPARGDEMFPEEEAPRLDRGTIEEFMQQVEATDPGEFERSSTPGNEMLAAMGQALSQAGRAPTLGEVLLAAGTGGTTAIAEHDAEQDQLAREAEQRRREFLRASAEQALAGEQALIESEMTARQFEQQGDRLRAQQEQRYINSMMERTDVSVSDDNIIVSQPEVDEQGNPTSKVTTTVLSNKDQEEIIDAAVLGGDPSNVETPEIAGVDVRKKWAGLSPAAKANILLSAHIVGGTLNWTDIPLKGARETLATIEQRAQQKVLQKYPSTDLEQFDVGMLAQVSGADADDIADDLEQTFHTELLAEMKANPALQASIWAASGNPLLASRGMQMLEEMRGSGER